MSAIIEAVSQSGDTLYAFLRDKAGQIWNGSSFVGYNVLNWSSYALALTEQTSSGYYTVTFPAAAAAGKYTIVIHQQQGGSPAAGDSVLGSAPYYFDGTSEEVGPGAALAAVKLDKLISVSASTTPPTVGSYLDKVMNKNSGQTFDPTTDSLEAIKDAGGGGPTASTIAAAVWDELMAGHTTTDSAGKRLMQIVNLLPATGALSNFDKSADKVNLNTDQSGVTVGTANALGTSAQAQVKSQMTDALSVDQLPELTAIPGATPTFAKAAMLIYMAFRNKRTATSSLEKVYNNSGSAIAQATLSDDGTTTVKEQFT